ncbi:hypothetical protein ThrDRAFT_00614 [Frankia casuarinae]|nr:hypothetical protein CcI6DRAFT_00620 [Frankia sp. CcI6]EYT93862.1 hypothetical protein ThrDRAFT_00614 [Frankia casuarinae]KDA44507.1 hypothetical protein BMG523Draft_00683 [Frankia sp. BMG5.23]KEZ37125.1 hypothetical protein CEDDRAFT_01376 [Frankia sp. CeD]KFB04364.1 hypothetical protein ALLO2DRAFT_02814 [Frankia sp. Allo2]
MDRHLRPAVS